MKLAFVLLWICAMVSAATAQETRETRVALVIGNGAYANVGALDNASRDAAAVAQALREAGFQSVQVVNDLGHDAMLKALRRFEEAADKADWALVYFAGHGIEVGGVNYLIPVDARISSDRDVDEEAVSLAQVQKRLEGARKLRLVILDACRDNPFLAKMRRMRIASRSVGRGLAVPDLPQTGSLVAYSAAAGQVALDGEKGGSNSPYAAALVKNLAKPDVEVNLFFRRVRVDVLRATGNKQEPATYESLPDDRLVLRPAPPGSPLARIVPAPAPVPTAALAPVVPMPASAPDRQSPTDACDRLAASPTDPDRPPGVTGTASKAIDSGAAIPACRAAVAAFGDMPAVASAGRSVTASSGPDGSGRRRMVFQLGRALEAGSLYGEAKARYEQAAAAGEASAMSSLGSMYRNGRGVARDYDMARKLYEQAIAAGDVNGMSGLGLMYQNGQGVDQDYDMARNLFEKAAAAGNASAMNSLGFMYKNGQGVVRSYGTARKLYEKAAAAGNATAMNNLGFMYQNGQGVVRDYGTARNLFEKAAAADNAHAMNNLGNLYQYGKGVARNYGVARSWYEKAAAAGNADAMNSLSDMYAEGRGVARDYAMARKLYEQAIAADDARAQAKSPRL